MCGVCKLYNVKAETILYVDLLKAVKGKDNMASVVPLLPMLGSLSQHPLATGNDATTLKIVCN